ncbi:MAG: MAPEG family protein, partial [Proteobacteria bacterium]|nr:MAPEG family protein [Pseudomonadota bacterium]
PSILAFAWPYVGLRVMHSVIHITYNRVLHRLTAFALSNVVLMALWIVVGLRTFRG